MATTLLLKLTTILSLTIPLLLALSFHSQTAFSTATEDNEEYVLDAPFANTRLRSRFLDSIKKGAHCNSHTKNICNGVSANHGTSLLYCCKTHCRNVLGDRNNCGKCGRKCGLGQLCCGGTCTNVAYDPAHCGKCHKICSPGLECEYGSCGYG